MIESNDLLLRAVRELPAESPDPSWERRVRARCREELTRRVAHNDRARQRSLWRSRLVQAVATVGLVLYLATVIGDTIRLAGWL